MPYFHKDPETVSFISTSRGNSVRPLVFTQQRAPHRRRLILVASAVASVAALIGLVWCCGPSPPGRAIAAEGGRVGESLRAFGKKLRRPAAAAAKPHGTPHWKPHMAPHEKPHGKAALRVDAPLRAARGMYSAPAVEAFAALAKLSYCGPLPGVFSSVALTCSLLEIPGATSVCERANFGVVPGLIRAFQASDRYRPDTVYGFLAQVKPGDLQGISSAVEPGVLIVFRGSIDNMANSERDKDTQLVPTGIDAVRVHKGYRETYERVASQVDMYLNELGCRGGNCTIYATGHGSGAAIAQIALMRLSAQGFRIGTSYLFSSPMVGDAGFASYMERMFQPGQGGPVFEVVEGKESAARWPFESDFRPWGFQAYYSKTSSKDVSSICYSDDPLCGINRVAQKDLTHSDVCDSALAPDGSFCSFGNDFAGQCYGGMSVSILHTIQNNTRIPLPRGIPQPADQQEQPWHPSEADGEQVASLVVEKKMPKPEDFFSLDVLKAMAALCKIAYCGSTPVFENVVVSTCSGQGGVCSKAGFGVVPHSVKPTIVADRGNSQALFFYTALARRTTREFAKAPYFMPAETCLLIFRGTANQENSQMNNALRQMSLDDAECENCTVSAGLLQIWDSKLGGKVVHALNVSGCTAQPSGVTSNKVIIAGHSMGGTMATLAAYKLHRLGFSVQLSWTIEGGRPGNMAFMDYINDQAFAVERPVPMWLVTHANDGIARWPKQVNKEAAGRLNYHVHFREGSLQNPTICTTAREATQAGRCGIFQHDRANLSFEVPSAAHCLLPFAPQGQMCMSGLPPPLPYATVRQCHLGGVLPL